MAKPLRERYRVPDRKLLLELVVPELRPGLDVLDMGSGRKPILSPGERPTTITYVGLDINAQEMEKAGDGGYDEVVIADIGVHQPSLDGRFDAVISFQVLEHVKPLDDAFSNVRLYLKPGGVFMAYFSGKFSIYGLLNQVLPHRASRFLLRKLLRRRDPSAYFPAYYHKCWYGALATLFADWDEVSIVPVYRGASYFSWSKPCSGVISFTRTGWYAATTATWLATTSSQPSARRTRSGTVGLSVDVRCARSARLEPCQIRIIRLGRTPDLLSSRGHARYRSLSLSGL